MCAECHRENTGTKVSPKEEERLGAWKEEALLLSDQQMAA